jgi:hypothetical protein
MRKPRAARQRNRRTIPDACIIYRGPSMIDGEEIVVIATGLRSASTNAKTGAMVQTWILRADLSPIDALRTGADKSICGGCQHRPKRHDGAKYYERSCYVNIATAPTGIFKKFARGGYPVIAPADLPALFADLAVRMGSYGDPAAVPVQVWDLVTREARALTGYTHQWKSARLRDVTRYCVASCDTEKDLAKARALGLGTFRVAPKGAPAMAGEIVCPASEEAGRLTDCASCLMCDGSKRNNVVIQAHGIGAQFVTLTRSK